MYTTYSHTPYFCDLLDPNNESWFKNIVCEMKFLIGYESEFSLKNSTTDSEKA